MLDVLILNFNDSSTVIRLVKHIQEYHNVSHILIVDNKSTDNSLETLQLLQSNKIIVIQSLKNGGYGYGNNLGINYLYEHYKSKYILLCNPDIIVDEDTLEKTISFLNNNKDYAIAAPMMTNVKGVVQYNTAFKIPNLFLFLISFDLFLSKTFKPFYYKFVNDLPEPYFDVGAVSGSMFLMDTQKMVECGMFDENIFLYCEELILGIKLRKAGFKTALLTNVRFIHNHSVSISKKYSSVLSKNKLLNKSRLYVLKHYYKASFTTMSIAKILTTMNLLESLVVDLLRKIRRSKGLL